jgi:excinuclease ABC subunit A
LTFAATSLHSKKTPVQCFFSGNYFNFFMPKASPKSHEENIIVKGARVNNLKNINIEIPRDKLVVVTGLSGSGKSSLVFDVVYAEGNRRYLEGMSSYARHFLDVSAKPDVDKIENLSPTISIDQRSVYRNPRSTVGTMTEIYDYLRVLFSKIGVPHCPYCLLPMGRISNQEILDEILRLPDKTQVGVFARMVGSKEHPREVLKNISQLGYARVRLDRVVMSSQEAMAKIGETNDQIESIEIVVDRMTFSRKTPDKERILDSIETAFKLGNGFLTISIDHERDLHYNRDFVCSKCLFKVGEITPKHFSFNSPEGACWECSGLGVIKEIDEDLVKRERKHGCPSKSGGSVRLFSWYIHKRSF